MCPVLAQHTAAVLLLRTEGKAVWLLHLAAALDHFPSALQCAGHVYRGGLKAASSSELRTAPHTPGQTEGSEDASSSAVASSGGAGKALVTPVALKVMDTGAAAC